MRVRRCAYGILAGKPEERRPLAKDPGVDGRIILKFNFEKWDVAWSGSIFLRIGTCGGLL
jgi:hypothetical protein